MPQAELADPVASTAAGTNGGGAAAFDRGVVAMLEQEIAARRVRTDALQAELDALMPEIKRYERALALLVNEPTSKPGPKPKGAGLVRPSKVADGQIAQTRDAVLAYAVDHDEFRQSDIRVVTGLSSSISSIAFERLRQEGVIRFARQEGNHKWYRLTRGAVREAAGS